MAVTGAIYNHLIFGGVDSADYGIYITGEAVYNAPSRAVDMITVPGRNGAVALDQGRFENIVVTYPAGTFGDDQADFRTVLSDFRNAILSQRGYQRLEDTYHPDEYRMGIYVEPIEVDPVHNGEAGQFTLSFNCKPQRFLTSGEIAITVSDGDTVTNPTPFESQPLLAVKGEGFVSIGNYSIELIHRDRGNVFLQPAVLDSGTRARILNIKGQFDGELLNTGDSITVSASQVTLNWGGDARLVELVSSSGINGTSINGPAASTTINIPSVVVGYIVSPDATNPPRQQVANVTLRLYDSQSQHWDVSIDITIANRSDIYGSQVFMYADYAIPSGCPFSVASWSMAIGACTGYSTVNVLGDPTYIDCETGEAYMETDTGIVSLNSNVDLGSDVPVLIPGENEITFNNTITEVKITPRWWKI